MSKLKEQLYILCIEYIKTRETDIKKNIAEAQEAANDDSKSSAGDKFETGRELMQQEIDLNLSRLADLDKLKQTLEKITPTMISSTAMPGCVVRTNNGNYYLSIGAGLLKVEDVGYYAISAASPIGLKLVGLKVGDTFVFNGKNYVVESVA